MSDIHKLKTKKQNLYIDEYPNPLMNKRKPLFTTEKSLFIYLEYQKERLKKSVFISGGVTFLILLPINVYGALRLEGVVLNKPWNFVAAVLLTFIIVFCCLFLDILDYLCHRIPALNFYQDGFEIPDITIRNILKQVEKRKIFVPYESVISITPLKVSQQGRGLHLQIMENGLIVRTNKPCGKDSETTYEIPLAFKHETLDFLKNVMGETKFYGVLR